MTAGVEEQILYMTDDIVTTTNVHKLTLLKVKSLLLMLEQLSFGAEVQGDYSNNFH